MSGPFEKFKFTGQKRGAEEPEDEGSAIKRPNPSLAAAPRPPPPAGGLPLELLGDAPLRLIIVGHNPSETAWRQGHYYANPANHMWRILRDTWLAPAPAISGAADDHRMPSLAGVGFTDVGSGHPGTDSSKFKASDFAAWRAPFFERLAAQATRAAAALGCTCGRCGAPLIVAFSGKRQFAELFEGGGKRGKAGPAAVTGGPEAAGSAAASPLGADSAVFQVRTQATRPAAIPLGRQAVLPSGWPLPAEATEVWVMTSTSGAAALTRAARYAPWEALAERLRGEAWPRPAAPRCAPAGRAAAGAEPGA